MAGIRHQKFIALLLVILPAVAMIYFQMSRSGVRTSETLELRVDDINPDKFYLEATNGMFSYAFTYDPHEADAWMFRTAEGSMAQLNPPSLGATNSTPIR